MPVSKAAKRWALLTILSMLAMLITRNCLCGLSYPAASYQG
jgi:hypothetical protein